MFPCNKMYDLYKQILNYKMQHHHFSSIECLDKAIHGILKFNYLYTHKILCLWLKDAQGGSSESGCLF